MADVLKDEPTKDVGSKTEETISQNTSQRDSIADSIVAKHYNQRQDIGIRERTKSPIFFMRNFNNWIKSVCIADTLQRLQRESDPGAKLTVLDLCCGKGGDLLKWQKGQINRLVCSDIAEVSLQQCRERYNELGNRNPREKVKFTAEFYTADLSKELLSEKYSDPSIQFDLTSCQFSFHYSFESRAQAETMLRNACERLRPGGYFIGTIPNGCELVRRLKASEGTQFGNNVYTVNFHREYDKFPLFGCTYDFNLEGVVDCPEFLLYFPLLEEMAKKYQMQLVYCESFHKYFEEHSKDQESKNLLGKMKSLEQYPPGGDYPLSSSTEGDYSHAEEHERSLEQQTGRPVKLGTLSKSEWEATSLYLVFAFRKETNSQPQNAT